MPGLRDILGREERENRRPRSEADATLAKCIGALQGLAESNPKWEALLTKHHIPVNAATDALHQVFAERESAESELKHVREGLRVIQAWDCLNPPDPNLCADHPWLKRHVDALLSASRPSVPAGEPEDIPIDYERADLEYRIEREVMGSDVKSFLNEPDGGGT